MTYRFKSKDKVYKYFPNADKYETQHRQTLEPKVYTIAVANSDGVILHNVPYILFNYDGEIIHMDYRKCPNVYVGKKIAGTKSLPTWSDAVIVPASMYNDVYDPVFSYSEKDSSDVMQEYEDKVYQL